MPSCGFCETGLGDAKLYLFCSIPAGGQLMKRIFIGIAAVASLLTTSAFAADLAARPYTKAPVYVDPVYNWTGFYIGGNIGYSWGRSRTDAAIFNNTTNALLATASSSFDMNGWV